MTVTFPVSLWARDLPVTPSSSLPQLVSPLLLLLLTGLTHFSINQLPESPSVSLHLTPSHTSLAASQQIEMHRISCLWSFFWTFCWCFDSFETDCVNKTINYYNVTIVNLRLTMTEVFQQGINYNNNTGGESFRLKCLKVCISKDRFLVECFFNI